MQKISIIIPTFNRRSLLCQALDSIRNQTFRPVEIIVVDDGSSDGTKEAVQVWSRNIEKDEALTLKYLQQENRGPGAARNFGLREAAGSFVLFLDSDDMLRGDGLLQLSSHATGLAAAVVGGAIELVDIGSVCSRIFLPVAESGRTALDDYIRGDLSINCGCWLLSTDLAQRVPPFPEDMFIAEDSIYFLKLIRECNKVARVREQVLALRVHDSGRLTDLGESLVAIEAEAKYMMECAQLIFSDSSAISVDTRNQVARKIMRLAVRLWASNRKFSKRLASTAYELNPKASPEYENISAKILWRLGGVSLCGLANRIAGR
ncbi:MAG: glycosyltransferase family A protein [Thermodesulfovibrionales bacterium]